LRLKIWLDTALGMAADPKGAFAIQVGDEELALIRRVGVVHQTYVSNLRTVIARVYPTPVGDANVEVSIVPGSFSLRSWKSSGGWFLRDLSVMKLTPFTSGEHGGGVSGYGYYFLGDPTKAQYDANLGWQEGGGHVTIRIAGADFLGNASPKNIYYRRHDNVVIYHGTYRGPASIKPLPATGV
jgi:hypothetical protein